MKLPKEALELAKRYRERIPVDVFGLAREIGLGPRIKELPDNVSGMINRNSIGDGMEIVVNKFHVRTRQRFTVAHEIGHYIYHYDKLGSGVTDTLAYRAEASARPNLLITGVEEAQANNFAANLLMPMQEVQRYRRLGETPQQLADRFDVSLVAMKIRLGLPA